MTRFPIDCPPDCQYLTGWDLSIDDLTYYCKKLDMQIDGCDTAIALLPLCPLKVRKEVENGQTD